jgi:hypothetical protein
MIVVIVSAFVLVSGLRNRQEMRAFFRVAFRNRGTAGHRGRDYFSSDALFDLAPENSLTAYAVASSPSSLVIAAIWWPLGFILAASYFVIISRQYTGK